MCGCFCVCDCVYVCVERGREKEREQSLGVCECMCVCMCVCVCVCVCVMRVWRENDIEKGGRENRAWECMSVWVCARARACTHRERMTEMG